MVRESPSARIQRQLLERIESGEYPHNGFLPPETELAQTFHAARNTVRKAISALAERGFIVKSQGKMSRIHHPNAVGSGPGRCLAWFSYVSPELMATNIIYFEMFKIMVELAREEGLSVHFFDACDMACQGRENLRAPEWVGYFAVGTDRRILGDAMYDRLRQLPDLIGIDETGNNPGVCNVSIDNFASARLGADYLLDLGYRNLMMVNTSNQSSLPFQERARGFQAAVRERSKVHASASVMELENQCDLLDNARQFEELLQKYPSVDAFFATTDTIALQLLTAARRIGLNVPGDIGILGFDGIYAGQHVSPRLATIAQPLREVVAAALKLALGHSVNSIQPPCNLRFPGRLIPGETLRKLADG